jgi:hypothetical protein
MKLYGMKILSHPRLVHFALQVKENVKALKVIGTIFFAATFISGVAWLKGKDAEPVTFVLSLCASIFFGLPHLAEFILPSRKPVKDMTYDELLIFILESDPIEDWVGLSKQWMNEVFLKEDPRLRFRAKFIDDGIQNDDFIAEWANRHRDKKAVGYWYDLYFDWNLIKRFILVSVDGGKAKIPPPRGHNKDIKELDYRVAQIHDTLQTLDEYLVRSGLRVIKGV